MPFRLQLEERDRSRRIRLSFATAEQVRRASSGEVTRADIVTVPAAYDGDDPLGVARPTQGGLSCEAVFGPVADFWADDRVDRFGHIELPCPVTHPWNPESRLEAILVLPPGLRRLVREGATYVADDVTLGYLNLLDECRKHHRLAEVGAPDELLDDVATGITAAVEIVFDNARRRSPHLAWGGRPQASLADGLMEQTSFDRALLWLRALGLHVELG